MSAIAATLCGYGIDSFGDAPILWCEAELRQAALFGEVLTLRRRVEMSLFENRIWLYDRVFNAGYRPVRHGILYHFNLGYSMLDEGSRLIGDFDPALVEDFRQTRPFPASDTAETVDQGNSSGNGEGISRVGLRNPTLGGGMSVEISYRASELPGLDLWRCYQSGIYAVGIEPNNGLRQDDTDYHGPGTPQYLEPGELREYHLEIQVGG